MPSPFVLAISHFADVCICMVVFHFFIYRCLIFQNVMFAVVYLFSTL